MRQLLKPREGNVDLILMAVVAAVVLAVSIVIVFSVMGGLDTTTVDANFANSTPAANASDDLSSNLETFYTISPIYVVVLAAVGIIAAIMMIVIKK